MTRATTMLFAAAALAAAVTVAGLSDAQAQDPAARGKKVYNANCMACHGEKGDGKGPAAVALNPKPTSFTAPEYWKGKTDEALKTSIKAGKPGTPMAPFPQLNDADVSALIVYLRGFGGDAAK
ncbi:MAG: cytochrome c [Deltaproteobacteria bacterium]|nr:cytochrome c [Deltaproteobacteria bacterium]MBK9365753.1 cytochrome c [Deltaproteobacteria bacterium]MBK9644356.1 cytochrome c [Deltaproteobacteria bacterium]